MVDLTSIWGRGKPTPWDVPGYLPCYMQYRIRAPRALLTFDTNLQPSSIISCIRLGAGDADDVPVLGNWVR